MSRSLHPPASILKIYREAFIGFRHTVQTVSTAYYSLKAMTLKTAPGVGTMGRTSIPRTGEQERSLKLPRFLPRVSQQSCPLNDLLQQLGR